jgi:glyoxylase-like metal-dependent hydrolase (beta-lactamase superfamily II)
VGGGVHWVRVPMPGPLSHINCWLIEDGERTALVDTGLNLGQSVAAWFARKFAAPIWMTRGEWLTAATAFAAAPGGPSDAQTGFWRAAGWSAAQIDAVSTMRTVRLRDMVTRLPGSYRRIVDGERIAIGSTEWRVVVGSGHCPEHACLWNERDGQLISGDQVLPRISSNVSLQIAEPEADPLGESLASIDRLLALPADLLVLPAHGDPFTGCTGGWRGCAASIWGKSTGCTRFWTRRAGRRIVSGGCSADRSRTRSWGSRAARRWRISAICHLRHLEVQGRAVRAVQEGVWWYRAA